MTNMQILHGTWIPDANANQDFRRSGKFVVWAESPVKLRNWQKTQSYPYQLNSSDLMKLLTDDLGLQSLIDSSYRQAIPTTYFLLPTVNQTPLPSLELSRYLEQDLPEEWEWDYWQINAVPLLTTTKVSSNQNATINSVIPLLNDLHFVTLHGLAEVQLGADLLFWFHFTQGLKRLIYKDQFIPGWIYRDLGLPTETVPKTPAKKTAKSSAKSSTTASRSQKTQSQTKVLSPLAEVYAGWQWIGDEYEAWLTQALDYMPGFCSAGFAELPTEPLFHDRHLLLRHFSECLLDDIVRHSYRTQSFSNLVKDTLIEAALTSPPVVKQYSGSTPEQYLAWKSWRDRLVKTQTQQSFQLYFQLQDPPTPDDLWQLFFCVGPKNDPSLRLTLRDYWRLSPKQQTQFQDSLGNQFGQDLLMNLGYAARIYPKLWQGLETDQPVSIVLELEEAFQFLSETSWVLENAGYKVIVPAWWTPQGRQRAKIRLQAKGKSAGSSQEKNKGYFSLETIVTYQYELSIAGETVSDQEWQQLVAAKVPLVQFRGQWLQLDPEKMQQMLAFWKTHQAENPEMTLMEFMQLTANQNEEDLEVECDRHSNLAEILHNLQNQCQLQTVENPDNFVGQLREYQKRGVAWLQYLERLGLNGCLADDMGLGKTVQVIAHLVQERNLATQAGERLSPTLLIAPTSVLGNWFHELQKFSPQLKAVIHHGNERHQDSNAFKQLCRDQDIVITSFGLARKDAKLFNGIQWHRVVLDEAQNIKNPKAALTKAILKFNADHRLALTGTPVENRLLDLWSIFNFLNPGYLGNQTQFRRGFEIPIQKDSNQRQAQTLKKLVEPFILRRVKTDSSIIQDLPDKVEQKLYCNLTKEQASLYEAVVKDVENQLENVEGIKRKGLILSTLMKLKQVCNHPRQFLQDNSDFTPERSHKLMRLVEMTEEVIAEGESLLLFTQFTDLGDALEKYLRQTCRYNTYYLHGGTSRNKREKMIAEFQDPDSEPSVFVLSLKAGGVGITLTRANHVFHFDRWWNPAVENQATDRAFRIGQKKNVFVHKFVAIGTLEEQIDTMIEDKKKLAGSIVGSDESWLTELDNDAFRSLIRLNQKAIL